MSVRLISSDNNIFTLSPELARLSARLNEMLDVANGDIEVDIPYLADDIEIVLECAHVLNDSETNITDDYVFYQILEQIADLNVGERVHQLSLDQLLRLMYIVDYLEIEPLINVYAYLLAEYIPKGTNPDVDLNVIFQVKIDDLRSRIHHIAEYQPLPEHILRYIRKHWFLREVKNAPIIEYTIADLLTIDIKPISIMNNMRHIADKQITSFRGIEHLLNTGTVKITVLFLDNNCLIDPYRDTYDVRSPFTKFTLLKTLDLTNNLLERLPNSFFSGLPNLRKLNLNNNRLIEVPTAISKLTLLAGLTLNDNLISRIRVTDFALLMNLEKLDLDGNQITQIDDNSFVNNTLLNEIQLMRNKLVNVSAEVFNGLHEMEIFMDPGSIDDDEAEKLHERFIETYIE